MPESEGAREPLDVLVEGPDYQHLERDRPGLWGLLLDAEVAARLLAALSGPVHPDSAAAVSEARNFLSQTLTIIRGSLAEEFLGVYGITPAAGAQSPFGDAGKARAFGVDTPQASGNT